MPQKAISFATNSYLGIHYESCIFLSLKTPVLYSPSDFQNLLYLPQDRPNNGKQKDTGYHGIHDQKVSRELAVL